MLAALLTYILSRAIWIRSRLRIHHTDPPQKLKRIMWQHSNRQHSLIFNLSLHFTSSRVRQTYTNKFMGRSLLLHVLSMLVRSTFPPCLFYFLYGFSYARLRLSCTRLLFLPTSYNHTYVIWNEPRSSSPTTIRNLRTLQIKIGNVFLCHVSFLLAYALYLTACNWRTWFIRDRDSDLGLLYCRCATGRQQMLSYRYMLYSPS
jgi:hypothetical protein